MKKIICLISMIAFVAFAYPQEYYSGKKQSSSNDQNNTNEPKVKVEKTLRNDDYNSLEARRVVFGITFGPSFNWMNWKNHNSIPEGYDRATPGMKLGLRYGVNMDIDLTKEKHFFVSTGILIEHTGGSLTFDENVVMIDTAFPRNIDRKYKSIYFTIPTAVTFRTPSFSNFIICGNIGLYHSFNLYSRYQSRFQIDPTAREVEKESINYVTTDWSVDSEVALFKESAFVGLGFEYVIKKNLKGKFYVNYAQSFLNYFNQNAKNNITGVQEKAAIGTVEILFGLSF